MAWREWVQDFEIEPSIYAANFAALGADLERALDAGARILHFDVGDGHFVEPITIGPIVLESIAPLVHARGAVLDCHLMVDNPERHFAQIAKAGGDSVTFHHEVVADVAATAAKARELGLGAGLAFNPESEVADVVARVEGVDLVLCMSIHPGYSGQAFMPEALERIRELRGALADTAYVQVDGGIKADNVRAAREAGAELWSPGARSSTASTRARPTAAWSTRQRDSSAPPGTISPPPFLGPPVPPPPPPLRLTRSRGRSSSPSGVAAPPGRIRWSGPSSCATARWSARAGTSGRASPTRRRWR